MYNNTSTAVHLLKYIQDPIGYNSVCELLDHPFESCFFFTADEIKEYKRVMKLFQSQINE